jgi:hypothetical protein
MDRRRKAGTTLVNDMDRVPGLSQREFQGETDFGSLWNNNLQRADNR